MPYPKTPWQPPARSPRMPTRPSRASPPPRPRSGFRFPQCGGVTFTLRFHFCTPATVEFAFVWLQTPREGGCLWWYGVMWGAGGVLGRVMMAGYEDISCCQWLGLSSLSMSCRSAWGRKAALSTLSILVALLIAGQAVTVYFVYQQSGQISKLTKTSQTLQLEALQRKLPTSQ